MTHDPLCYAIDKLWAQEADGSWECMDCAFIAKVRADERKQATTAKATVHVCADNNCWCPKSLSRSELS